MDVFGLYELFALVAKEICLAPFPPLASLFMFSKKEKDQTQQIAEF